MQQSDGEFDRRRRRLQLLVSLQAASYNAAPFYASRRPASAASGGLGYYLCLPRTLLAPAGWRA